MITSKGITELKSKILKRMDDFFRRNGIDEVVVGFSGGMDSTVSALLCSEVLGWDKIELVHLHFGIFSYRKTLENVKKFGDRINRRITFLHAQKDQVEVWKHGPSCNLCTKKVKFGRLKEYAKDRVIISGANRSDSWGNYGLEFHDGVYSPLFSLNKEEIHSLLLDYGFNLEDVKVGERGNLHREGCKLKHLLKMLISLEYHGNAVAKSNEILLEVVEEAGFSPDLANVKVIGPLGRNVALVNLHPLPPHKLRRIILERLGELKELDEVHIVDRDLKLTVMANPGLFNDEKSRKMIEIGKFKMEFSKNVAIEWKKSKNNKLWTFHVVDFEWR